MEDVLGACPTTKTTSSLMLLRGISSPRAWRHEGRLLLCTRESQSNETTHCQGEDLCDNWNKKLCNHMQQPTGMPGALTNRIFCCLVIECRIQDEAKVAILGVNLAESSHGCDDGLSLLLDKDNIPVAAGGEDGGDNTVSGCGKGGGPPVNDIEFNHGGGNESGEDDDEEVAAANLNMNVPGEGTGHSHPPFFFRGTCRIPHDSSGFLIFGGISSQEPLFCPQ